MPDIGVNRFCHFSYAYSKVVRIFTYLRHIYYVVLPFVRPFSAGCCMLCANHY